MLLLSRPFVWTRRGFALAGHLKRFRMSLAALAAGALIAAPLHAQDIPNTQQLTPELRALIQAYERIRNQYVDSTDDHKLVTAAINGMVASLDPHSAFLDPDALSELRAGTRGQFTGLGIDVSMEDGLVKVLSVTDGTPAYRAGLRTGDLLTKLGDVNVKGLTLAEAIARARGKPDTDITLTVLRDGDPAPRIVTLKRTVIRVHSVEHSLLEPGIGYVRITQFQERTGDELVRALGQLWHESAAPMRGIVLDLRDNPGGLLRAAVAVCAAFLPEDAPVVYTEGRNAESKRQFLASSRYYLRGEQEDFMQRLPAGAKNVPLVLLVNNASASASEIVAAALQDHGRAMVVGTQTFGKGSIQAVFTLEDGSAVKLTTALYLTPKGRYIQARGVTPDILVEAAEGASAEQVDHLREADLEHHLHGAGEPAKTHAVAAVPDARPRPPVPAVRPPAVGGEADPQLRRALELLKHLRLADNR